MASILILGVLGAKAYYLLMVWLVSAFLSSELSNRKGYGEKLGLGTGLLLSAVGVVIWLLMPARENSVWKERGLRRRPSGRDFPTKSA